MCGYERGDGAWGEMSTRFQDREREGGEGERWEKEKEREGDGEIGKSEVERDWNRKGGRQAPAEPGMRR